MTEKEIQELFVRNSFADAKRTLVRYIESIGVPLTGNEHVFELKALALEGGSTQTLSAEGVRHVQGTVEEGTEKPPEKLEAGDPTASVKSTEPNQTEQHQDPSNSQTQSQSEFELERQEEPEQSKGSEQKGEGTEENGTESVQKEESQTQEEQQTQEQPEQSQEPRRRGRKKKEQTPEEKIQSAESEASKKESQIQNLIEEAKRLREEAERIRKEEEEKRRAAQNKRKDHYQTDEVVRRLKCLGKAFLVGPAGTGKSTIAIQACAKIFGLDGINGVMKSDKFAQISFSPDTVSADMIGFTDVNGKYHETDVVRVFRDGGVILFDEMDDADASLLVKLNTMLSNDVIPTPYGVVTKNENTYIVGTANTFGKGGNSMYVGRSRLDAATLDRWKLSTIEIEYDNAMEESIVESCGLDPDVAKKIMCATKVMRNLISSNNWKQICSTRFVIDAAKMAKAGYPITAITNTFLADWDDNSRRIVSSGIRDALKQGE